MSLRGGRIRLVALSVFFCAVIAAAIAPSFATAELPIFWQAQVSQITPGARAIAANPDTGNIYVSDQNGQRIVELDAWGTLVRMWGWDVVESGPDETVTDQLEVCVPKNGDICKVGIAGTAGAGQLNNAAGLAIDSAGNVYAAETGAPRRVQKFSPNGNFLLSFGGGVNQGGGTPSSPGNVCTPQHIANADVCGAGSTGTGPSQFSGSIGALRTVIAITTDDKVWVGDKERIQRFNPAGEYQGQLNIPGEAVQQLAVDDDGFLYVSYESASEPNEAKDDVFKLNPITGAVVQTFKVKNPRAISIAPNDDVYVFDATSAKVHHFDSSGKEVESPFGEGLSKLSIGLATSTACGIDGVDVLFSNAIPSFVRAYGPHPDPAVCPQPILPPEITSQYAASVGTDSAALEAKINPHFWPDATYYLEYGTVDCEVGPCEAVLLPGAPLTTELVNEALTAHADLGGLTPDTTYHFRFVAESGGGGPIFGPDATFTTRRVPVLDTGCANQSLRTATSAALPDCRAYEMVSPVDKNGGDADAYFYEGLNPVLNVKFTGLDRSTPDGAKLTYTATSSFADPEGSPLYTQYIASRGAGGWTSESIDPPMEGGAANKAERSSSQFKAFSADLCQGWAIPEAGTPLAPGPVEGFRNLYRRDNCTTPPAYTWLESSAPKPEPCLNPACETPFLYPDLQGVGREGECAVFRVNDALTADAPKGLPGPGSSSTAVQLYLKCEGTPVRLVSVQTNGKAFNGGWSSAGTENGGSQGSETEGSSGEGHIASVEHALSEDGTRVYWTTSSATVPVPHLFLRFNADAAPLPSIEGTGDFTQIASGKGTVTKGSAVITGFSTTTGTFAVGESITGLAIPAGTTIVALEGTTLTMSSPATNTFSNTTLGSFSKVISNVTTSTGAFAVGQPIFATGIPAGSTITAVGAGTLTVSIAPTTVKAAATLRAIEECTAPDLPCTLPVSPETVSDKPQFWTANPQGTRAIYSILSGEDAGNLYEFNFNPAEGKGASTKIAGKTLGVAGASEDAKRVYFASEEVCSGATPNSEGDVALKGEANLYLYEEGESCAAGQMAFVGTLAGQDISNGGIITARPSPVAAVPRNRLARATADGEHLAFVATTPLTGYDNTDAGSGQADREVFLYDAGAGKLLCASCNPSGSRPKGANLGSPEQPPLWSAAWIPGYQNQLYGRRLITANGNRLFFNSVDALGLRDVNGAQDVYQWEAPGTGRCTTASSRYSAQNEGCLDLISSGQDSRDSEWVEASQSGDDVFFRTEASLVKVDPGSVDIYDARVGGGFAEPEAPSACEGDSCQAPPPAPGFQTPASETFNGPANAKVGKRRCAKGKVRRKGHCVAKKHKRKSKASRSRRAGR